MQFHQQSFPPPAQWLLLWYSLTRFHHNNHRAKRGGGGKIGSLRFTTRQLDDAPSKQRIFLQKTRARNNLWSEKCSELRSHSQYNVKLSIITSLEKRESMLRRGECYWSPAYNRHRIVSANKTVCKLLKQASNGHYSIQIPESFFSFIYIDIASLSRRLVDLKLPSEWCNCTI